MLQLQAGCLFSLWLTALIWMLQCINKQINSLCHKVGHVIYLFDKKLSASAVHSLLSPLVNSCKVWTKEKKDKYQDKKKKTPIQNGTIVSKFRYQCSQWDNSIWNQIVSKIQTRVGSIYMTKFSVKFYFLCMLSTDWDSTLNWLWWCNFLERQSHEWSYIQK